MTTSIEPGQVPTFWKKCSSCKKEIGFKDVYYLCSVSTCRTSRTGYQFCSVNCWDAHLGVANHRHAEADEMHAPNLDAYQEELMNDQTKQDKTDSGKRTIVRPSITGDDLQQTSPVQLMDVDTLVVVSKVKKLIRDQSEMNCSQCAIDALTQKIVAECLQAIQNAQNAGRKTVMGRDF